MKHATHSALLAACGIGLACHSFDREIDLVVCSPKTGPQGWWHIHVGWHVSWHQAMDMLVPLVCKAVRSATLPGYEAQIARPGVAARRTDAAPDRQVGLPDGSAPAKKQDAKFIIQFGESR